jgi:hypothetical protein
MAGTFPRRLGKAQMPRHPQQKRWARREVRLYPPDQASEASNCGGTSALNHLPPKTCLGHARSSREGDRQADGIGATSR